MNFFERQHRARGTTLRLVVLYLAAIVCIVAVIDLLLLAFTRGQPASSVITWMIVATVITLLIIGGGTLTKTLALRSGGAAVAHSLGAVAVDPSTTDPQLRRFVNVVQEMSIASGVPVPRMFVLEREAGINAFAAGYSPADAAITVTGGALHRLNRDELQGVIGHEFSHILNGDMRLNIRLIGLLNGLVVLSLIGLRIMMFGGGGRSRSDRDNGAAPILVFALAMMVLGFLGQLFARVIKAAVSRQREWLADASSVQFTRQTRGLEGALKKIAGLPAGSQLADKHGASQVSHMLFGEGGRAFSGLFATHPPLFERIAALDPSFRPEQVAALRGGWAAEPPDGLAEDAAAGLTGPGQQPPPSPASGGAQRTDPAQVGARVGSLSAPDVARGAELSAQLPVQLRRLAGQPSTATALVLALALNAEPAVRGGQLALIGQRLGRNDADAAARMAGELAALAPQLRLPLAAMAAPMLAARPPAARQALIEALYELARADDRVSLFEYCLTRLVAGYLHDASAPARRSRPGRGDVHGARAAVLTLLAALAAAGNDDPEAAAHAFGTALAHVLPGEPAPYQPPPAAGAWRALDAGWPVLDALDPRQKQQLVEAMVAAVRDDGVLTLHEAELLRTACALLHCPLPAFVA